MITRHDYMVSALVILAAYLHSPTCAVAAVLLYSVEVAKVVLQSKGKDAEINALILRAEAYEKRLKVLENDLVSVADRAKTILGEQY